MESKTKNRKTRAQIVRMVERAFPGIALADGENAVIELKDGWFNVAYNVRLSDGRETILKIAPPEHAEVLSYEKNIMAIEVSAMRLVAQNPAIPVPAVYCYDTARDLCDSAYFFMEKLAGDNYGTIKSSLSPEVQTQIDRSIGVIIREINGFTGAYFGCEGNSALRGETWREAFLLITDAVLEDGQRKKAEYGFDIDEIRSAILKHAPSLDSITTPQLVHWDAWDTNFFVKGGKITGIIDFERARWAEPLFEAQFRALAFDGVSESMQGYGKTTFTHEETQRCHLYTLYLALVLKTECYYRNYDSDFASNLGSKLLVSTMRWLQEH